MTTIETPLKLFVTTAPNLEGLLVDELQTLGAAHVRETRLGAHCAGSLETAYRVCLWSRLASRVLLKLAELQADSADALYEGARDCAWEDHLDRQHSFAVDFVGTSEALRDSRYGAVRVKDAIADRFRARFGTRPDVNVRNPALRVNVHLRRQTATVAIDFSGDALHRRGYRGQGGQAPLKESLAAALLVRAGWPALAAEGAALFDPLCGSGTLLIEGAMMANHIAPGSLRERFGFHGWRGHDQDLWRRLLEEAEHRRQTQPAGLGPMLGCDAQADAIAAARANARRAGIEHRLRFERRALAEQPAQAPAAYGLMITNPPYGHRLAPDRPPEQLYMALGDWARRALPGWRAAVFGARSEHLAALGLRSERIYRLYNGALPSRLGVYRLDDAPRSTTQAPAAVEAPAGLVNRLRKNARHLARWARREGVGCYRVYDADIPEYAVAVDLYYADRLYAHVQEYAPPAAIAPRKAQQRREEAMAAVRKAFALDESAVSLKLRRRRRGYEQYSQASGDGGFLVVEEPGGCRLQVNLTAYLDTGLFLDHRPLRQRIRREAQGQRFLNLFGYTGSASVHAALGGARSTTTVDLSRTYLDWARRNLALNGLDGERHELVRADCLEWLAAQSSRGDRQRYDLILLDPPSASRSREMKTAFDVQRDHGDLIRAAAALLTVDGTLYFSTNRRRFRLDLSALADLRVGDITAQTIPPDFARNPRIHRCWRVHHR